MENKTAHKIIYGVLALAVLLVLFVCTYPLTNKLGVRLAEKQNVDVVLLGDSIFANHQDESGIGAKLGELTGKEVFNAALGGTCAAHMSGDYAEGYYKGTLPFCELSISILADEFGPQLKGRNSESATDYFITSIARMATTDYSSADFFFICYGVNDYHAGVLVSNEENPYDIDTYKGAVRFGVNNLRKACPGARIVLVTSPYTWYVDDLRSCEEFSPGGTFLEEYVQATIDLAQEENCLLIDLYHDLYDSRNLRDWSKYTEDGIHPNESTREAIAQRLSDLISKYEG